MVSLTADIPLPTRTRMPVLHAVLAMMARDAHVVLRRQLFTFLSRVLVQPLLLLFTFSFVLPATHMGVATSGVSLGTIMAPGIVASTMIYTGIMSVTVPLITQLTFPREIDDRVLSPVPVWALAVQKVMSGAWQSLLGALLVLPIITFLHTRGQAPDLHIHSWALLVTTFAFGAVLSSCFGLILGTLLDPAQTNVLFTVIMMPALMLGCVYFPWSALGNVPWLQYAVLINPIVYLSEAFRASLTPGLAHMPDWAFLTALIGGTVFTFFLGIRSFARRVRK